MSERLSWPLHIKWTITVFITKLLSCISRICTVFNLSAVRRSLFFFFLTVQLLSFNHRAVAAAHFFNGTESV